MAAKQATTKPRGAAAQEGFEATCPTCGMTADVGPEVEHVRCKGCGTVIRLVDHPVAREGTDGPAPAADRVGLGLAIGLVGPILVCLAFVQGHGFMDQPEPDTGSAGFWYLATVLLAAAAAYSMWPLLRPRTGAYAPWGLLSLVPVLWFAIIWGTSYADEDLGQGLVFAFYALPLIIAYYVAMLITLAVQASRGKSAAAMPAVLVGGVGACAGIGLAAAYLLLTLQSQADAARQAHQDAPAWGVLLVGSVLLAMAALRRRR